MIKHCCGEKLIDSKRTKIVVLSLYTVEVVACMLAQKKNNSLPLSLPPESHLNGLGRSNSANSSSTHVRIDVSLRYKSSNLDWFVNGSQKITLFQNSNESSAHSNEHKQLHEYSIKVFVLTCMTWEFYSIRMNVEFKQNSQARFGSACRKFYSDSESDISLIVLKSLLRWMHLFQFSLMSIWQHWSRRVRIRYSLAHGFHLVFLFLFMNNFRCRNIIFAGKTDSHQTEKHSCCGNSQANFPSNVSQ